MGPGINHSVAPVLSFPIGKTGRKYLPPGCWKGLLHVGLRGAESQRACSPVGLVPALRQALEPILAGRCLCCTGGQMILRVPWGPSHVILAPITCSSHNTWYTCLCGASLRFWASSPLRQREVASGELPRGGHIWQPGPSGQRPFKQEHIAPATPLCQNAGGGQARMSLPPGSAGAWGPGAQESQGREPAAAVSSSDSFRICLESCVW